MRGRVDSEFATGDFTPSAIARISVISVSLALLSLGPMNGAGFGPAPASAEETTREARIAYLKKHALPSPRMPILPISSPFDK
jgi:hypothetical protein